VVDEEDATDVANPRQVSVRIYPIHNVVLTTNESQYDECVTVSAVSRAGQSTGEVPNISSPRRSKRAPRPSDCAR
jgi:hypothetical protein